MKRSNIVEFLERIAFKIESSRWVFGKPECSYQMAYGNMQAVPGARGAGTLLRWNHIRGAFPAGSQTLKDIGCCEGYFCAAAAVEFKVWALGIDRNARFLKMAEHLMPPTEKTVSFMNLDLTPENCRILPKTDVTICLSIWHHWYDGYGSEGAESMLKAIWESTCQCMFFESGQEDASSEFKQPEWNTEGAESWLKKYLERVCPGGTVRVLGDIPPPEYHPGSTKHARALFCVERK